MIKSIFQNSNFVGSKVIKFESNHYLCLITIIFFEIKVNLQEHAVVFGIEDGNFGSINFDSITI